MALDFETSNEFLVIEQLKEKKIMPNGVKIYRIRHLNNLAE